MAAEGIYQVSHIVDEDLSRTNGRVFLIRWKGYGPDFDSWEPIENFLPGALSAVNEWDEAKSSRKRASASQSANPPRKKARTTGGTQGDPQTTVRPPVTPPAAKVLSKTTTY
jgi:Chromo (CHRromatin Organisation MOdifier) domain